MGCVLYAVPCELGGTLEGVVSVGEVEAGGRGWEYAAHFRYDERHYAEPMVRKHDPLTGLHDAEEALREILRQQHGPTVVLPRRLLAILLQIERCGGNCQEP